MSDTYFKQSFMRRLALKLTHRLWNREISRILNRLYMAGTISSATLHVLSKQFDPTQDHMVYKRKQP